MEVKYVGLSNQGATCYMNSLLQTLFMTPEFRKALYSWQFNENEHGKAEDNIPLQLQLIFAQLQQNAHRQNVNTRNLIHSFQWDHIEAFQQHDVQEFCRVLFDAIEESCRGTKQETFIRDLYEGTLTSYVTCLKCKYDSERNDKFLDLSVTVKNQYDHTIYDSLEKGLLSYLKPEFLEKENQYYCEKCAAKVDAVKGIKLRSLPKILTFQLNRFELDFTSFQRKKINNKVTFPYILNMNEFLKDFNEVQVGGKDPQFDLYKGICGLVKENESARPGEGYFPDQILKNINKGSNTYEGFEDKVKQKPKMYDDFTMKKSYRDDFKVGEGDKYAGNYNYDKIQPREPETFLLFREDQKLLDEKLQKIMDRKKNDITKKKKKDEIDDDPLFGNKNPFTGATEAKSNNNNIPLIESIDETIELNQMLNSLEAEKELYKDKGPLVYELFSINMHTGSAMGGHYYTFIKSFENGLWYTFNDIMVTKLRADELKKAFGEENPRYDSGISAYMLFYRLCEQDFSHEKPEIPEKLMKIFEEEEIEIKKREEIEEKIRQEKNSQLNLKVLYRLVEKNFLMKKTDKFSDFLEKVSREMNIQETPDNWRLRLYNYFEDIMQDSYKGREDMSLDDLHIKNFKNFIVETKAENEIFEDYDPHKITLKVNLWKENIISLEEKDLKPIKVQVEDNLTLLNLMLLFGQKFNIQFQNQLLLKRTPFLSVGYSEILNRNEDAFEKSLSSHKVFNGVNIFLEEKNTTYSQDNISKWNTEFELEKNRCFIKYNDPRIDPQPDQPVFSEVLTIDNRKRIIDLKKKLSDLLNLPLNSFVMKRESKVGNEYKDLECLIKDKFIAHSKVYLEKGTPSKNGEYRLFFSIGCLSQIKTDTISYDYEELAELPISAFSKVLAIKEMVCEVLFERKKELGKLDPMKMRLRERNSDKLGQIFHNDHLMRDYALYDKKAIVIERLEETEKTTSDDLLIMVKRWDMKKFELEGPWEVFVKKADKLKHFAMILSSKFEISEEDIEACKIGSLWCFNRGDLLNENWVTLKDNESLIVSDPWFAGRDGAFVVKKSENVKIDDKGLMDNLKNFHSEWKHFKPEIGNAKKETGNNKEKACLIKVKKKSEAKDDFDTKKKTKDEEKKGMSRDI